MTGNTLGPRKGYAYTDDVGAKLIYFTDEDLGAAVDADEPDEAATDLPRAFKPRGVYIRGKDKPTLKKFLIIGDKDSELFKTNVSKEVEVDGETFVTTGRRGESKTFRGGASAEGGGDGDGGGGGEP